MTFEDALIELKKGKKIKIPEQDSYLSIIEQVFYDGNTDRPVEILSIQHHILRNDWEIID